MMTLKIGYSILLLLFVIPRKAVPLETLTLYRNDSIVDEIPSKTETLSVINSLLSPSGQIIALILVVYYSSGKHLSPLLDTLNRYRFSKSFMYVLRKILKTVVGTVVLLLLIPLFLPIYLTLLLIKKFFMMLIRYEHRNAIAEPLGMDLIWATKSRLKCPIITALVKLEGKLEKDHILKKFEKIVKCSRNKNGENPFRKFSQTYESFYGYFVWKDVENLEIRNHVKVIDLRDIYSEEEFEEERTNEETSACSEGLLCRFLREHFDTYLSSEKPHLWEEDSGLIRNVSS